MDEMIKITVPIFGYKAEITIRSLNPKVIFEKLSPLMSDLPKTGPNGEEGLIPTVRTTKDGDTYFSIVCPEAQKEFQLGQKKADGTLFPKGWHSLWTPGNSSEVRESGQSSERTKVPKRATSEKSSSVGNSPSEEDIERVAAGFTGEDDVPF